MERDTERGQLTRIVVAEPGAPWFFHVPPFVHEPTLVIARTPEEDLTAFRLRLAARLAALSAATGVHVVLLSTLAASP